MKLWLNEYNKFTIDEVEDEDSAFNLEIKPKSKPKVLPVYIIFPKEADTEIILGWIWGFADIDIKTLRGVNIRTKQKFTMDVNLNLLPLSLTLGFLESLEEIKAIHTEKYIQLDELSKDKLSKTIDELGFALTLVGEKFLEYFKIPSKFDSDFDV